MIITEYDNYSIFNIFLKNPEDHSDYKTPSHEKSTDCPEFKKNF